MDRISVKSKSIKSVAYEPMYFALEIEFIGGELRQYNDVPEFVYWDFIDAPSQGTYFKMHIEKEFKFVEIKEV